MLWADGRSDDAPAVAGASFLSRTVFLVPGQCTRTDSAAA